MTPISSGLTEEAATQYRELFEKYSAVQTDNQTLRSEKIILDNNGTQLRVSLETEKEKLVATEQVNAWLDIIIWIFLRTLGSNYSACFLSLNQKFLEPAHILGTISSFRYIYAIFQ